MPTSTEIGTIVNQAQIGLEAEGRVCDRTSGELLYLNQTLVGTIRRLCGYAYTSAEGGTRDGLDHFYGTLELKTHPHRDANAAVLSLLRLRRHAEAVVAHRHPHAKLVFDSRIPDHRQGYGPYEIGTQMHLDLRHTLPHFFPDIRPAGRQELVIAQKIAYLVQQDMPNAIRQFCYSPRITSLVESGVLSPDYGLPFPLSLRKGPKSGAVVYRPHLGTLEACTPDSTLDPISILAMVRYYRERVAVAIGYLLAHSDFALPTDAERFRERTALIEWARTHGDVITANAPARALPRLALSAVRRPSHSHPRPLR